jgi:hypothetical protein
MDFKFFDSLSQDNASEFLVAFLRVEKAATSIMAEVAKQEGINADFTLDSLPSVVLWAIRHVEIVKRPSNASLPVWITATDGYQRGLFEFSDQSKPLILRVAYYFGECFVRRFERLRWSIGDRDTALQNMPVVTGFGRQIELAPILVTENLFRRTFAGGEPNDAIRRAVNHWIACAEAK